MLEHYIPPFLKRNLINATHQGYKEKKNESFINKTKQNLA